MAIDWTCETNFEKNPVISPDKLLQIISVCLGFGCIFGTKADMLNIQNHESQVMNNELNSSPTWRPPTGSRKFRQMVLSSWAGGTVILLICTGVMAGDMQSERARNAMSEAERNEERIQRSTQRGENPTSLTEKYLDELINIERNSAEAQRQQIMAQQDDIPSFFRHLIGSWFWVCMALMGLSYLSEIAKRGDKEVR